MLLLSAAFWLMARLPAILVLPWFIISFYLVHRRVGYRRLRKPLYALTSEALLMKGKSIHWLDIRRLEPIGGSDKPQIAFWLFGSGSDLPDFTCSALVRHLDPAGFHGLLASYHVQYGSAPAA